VTKPDVPNTAEEGRNFAFEEEATAAGIPICFRCTCGTKFCQHDQATTNRCAEYTSETKGAWIMWNQLQQALATTQQERDDALDLIRKLYIRQAIQPASQSQWVERWLKERGISWRQG